MNLNINMSSTNHELDEQAIRLMIDGRLWYENEKINSHVAQWYEKENRSSDDQRCGDNDDLALHCLHPRESEPGPNCGNDVADRVDAEYPSDRFERLVHISRQVQQSRTGDCQITAKWVAQADNADNEQIVANAWFWAGGGARLLLLFKVGHFQPVWISKWNPGKGGRENRKF